MKPLNYYWEKEIERKPKMKKKKEEESSVIMKEFKMGDVIKLKGEIFWGKNNFISRNFKDFKFQILKVYKDFVYVKIVSHSTKVLLVTYTSEQSYSQLVTKLEKIQQEKDTLKDMKFIFNKTSLE